MRRCVGHDAATGGHPQDQCPLVCGDHTVGPGDLDERDDEQETQIRRRDAGFLQLVEQCVVSVLQCGTEDSALVLATAIGSEPVEQETLLFSEVLLFERVLPILHPPSRWHGSSLDAEMLCSDPQPGRAP